MRKKTMGYVSIFALTFALGLGVAISTPVVAESCTQPYCLETSSSIPECGGGSGSYIWTNHVDYVIPLECCGQVTGIVCERIGKTNSIFGIP